MQNRIFAATAIVVVLTASLLGAKGEKDGEWISLFDGKTLNGWKANELPDQWKVVDGTIVVNGERSHLFYIGPDLSHPAEFKNFDFKAEVMTKAKSNSGVYFHTRMKDKDEWPSIGYECQVNTSHRDPVKTGSIYNVVKNFVPPSEDDKWFTLEISVDGKHIVTRVDGKVVVDFTEPDGELAGDRKLSSGTFALQAHDPGSTVLYKNLMVRPKK